MKAKPIESAAVTPAQSAPAFGHRQVPPGQTIGVILLDADRTQETPITIDLNHFRYQLIVDGRSYHHVDTTPEGVWRYAPV